MAELRYDQMDVLLIDPDGGSRASIRSILQSQGVRRVRSGSTFMDLLKGTEPPGPDLLICETDIEDGDVCQWIHDMRHQRAGCDPFLTVIATTWTPTPDLVKRVVDAGADHLLTKPLSADLLLGRIRTLVRARKPFVVTSDYVGPDRHRTQKRPNTASLVAVPSRLQARVGQGESDVLGVAISEALEAINRQKIDRHAHRIGDMVRRLLPKLEARLDDDTVNRDLRVLHEVTADISERLAGTAYGHVSELCQSLLTVIGSIRAAPRRAPVRDLRLLVPLSQAIEAGFAGAEQTAETAREILAAIEGTDSPDVFLDAETTQALAKAEAKAPPTERRHKFLLRLIAGKISHLLSNHVGGRHVVPRAFLQGFDEYLMMLLGEKLYEELNPKARKLLESVDSDDDAVIWRTILENDEQRAFSYSILVHLLLKFSNFARGRRNFMGIVNTAIAEILRDEGRYGGRDVFTEGHFNLVFATLFSDIFETLDSEEGREQLDALLGNGTCRQLEQIREEYHRHIRQAATERAP